MFDLNYKIQILFVILSIILSVHGFEISILNVRTDFKCKTNIIINTAPNGQPIYKTNLQPIDQDIPDGTRSILFYVVPEERFKDIAHFNGIINRCNLADKMKQINYELIVLGVDDYQMYEFGLVARLIADLRGNIDAHILSELFSTESSHLNLELPPFLTVGGRHSAYPVLTLGQYLTNNFPEMLYKSKRSDLYEIMRVNEMNEATGSGSRPKGLEIYDFNAPPGQNFRQMNITLLNGQYVPQDTQYHFSSQYIIYPNIKFAFIVVDSTEMASQNVLSKGSVYAKQLIQTENTVVFLIKALNFRFDDLHIIPEWIESHRGATNPNRITILGGGKFYTSYQYFSPLYQVSYIFTVVPNILKWMRQQYIETVETKAVFVFNIDTVNPESKVQTYPMHTINGYYDPVVFPLEDMLFTGIMNILFIIMDATKFQKITDKATWKKIRNLRENIKGVYTAVGWTVYFVAFHDFQTSDLNLFAEFVKIHTNDRRQLGEFIHILTDSSYKMEHLFEDTLPFPIENNPRINKFLAEFS